VARAEIQLSMSQGSGSMSAESFGGANLPAIAGSKPQRLAAISESMLLSLLEPAALEFKWEHEREVPRVRAAIRRSGAATIARFRPAVNRKGFLLGCLDFTELRDDEHLIVGYGFRHGSTTKVGGVHHVVGNHGSVAIPTSVGHMMWDHYRRDESNEVILFHNHPITPLGLLLDNPPFPSPADRLALERRSFNSQQVLRSLLGAGRVLFYLGENGYVKQFRLPSFASLLERVAMSENGVSS